MTGPQWAGGAPSFSVTVTPAEVLPLLRAAIVWPEDGTERIKLALALEWLEWKVSNPVTENKFETEDARLAAAEAAGRAVAQFQLQAGHRVPQDWTRDDNPYAGAYSHLAAVGFTRLGCRTYALPFINAYRAEFPATEDTTEGLNNV